MWRLIVYSQKGCNSLRHYNKIIKIYKQMTIKFKKILENAVQPVRVVDNGAGYNLVAVDIAMELNKRGQYNVVYRTGLGVEIPEGYVGILSTPSDIHETTFRMTSCPILKGVINDEIVVRYINTTDVIPAAYNNGDVIAKLNIIKAEDVEFVEYIDTTEQSATEGDQSLSENEDMSINSDKPETVSGDAENSVEGA